MGPWEVPTREPLKGESAAQTGSGLMFPQAGFWSHVQDPGYGRT